MFTFSLELDDDRVMPVSIVDGTVKFAIVCVLDLQDLYNAHLTCRQHLLTNVVTTETVNINMKIS